MILMMSSGGDDVVQKVSWCTFICLANIHIHTYIHFSIHPNICHLSIHAQHTWEYVYLYDQAVFYRKVIFQKKVDTTFTLPWKENHKFTRKGCSKEESNSTSLSTPPKAPRLSHAERLTYFMAYNTPLSRFCTMQTCQRGREEEAWKR